MEQKQGDISESMGELKQLRHRIVELEAAVSRNRKIEIDIKESEEEFRATPCE